MSPSRASGIGTGATGAEGHRRRRRRRLLVELPLLVWMTLLWGAVWMDFSAGNLLFGLLLSLGIVSVFRLPPVELGGRFNAVRAAVFALRFVRDVAVASFVVMGLAVVKGPRVRNAVVGVRLRSREDLMTTVLGHVLTLIPGSYVVEVDRPHATLYLHVLNVETPADAERFRQSVRDTEARLIEVMGTPRELAELRAERARTQEGTT